MSCRLRSLRDNLGTRLVPADVSADGPGRITASTIASRQGAASSVCRGPSQRTNSGVRYSSQQFDSRTSKRVKVFLGKAGSSYAAPAAWGECHWGDDRITGSSGLITSGHEFSNIVNPTETVNDNGQRKCSATRATIADGNYNKGSARGTVYSTTGSACNFAVDKVAGNLKVKTQYFFRDNGDWGLCWGDGWHDNPNQDWTYSRYREWENNQPCGQGYYRVEATGGVKRKAIGRALA